MYGSLDYSGCGMDFDVNFPDVYLCWLVLIGLARFGRGCTLRSSWISPNLSRFPNDETLGGSGVVVGRAALHVCDLGEAGGIRLVRVVRCGLVGIIEVLCIVSSMLRRITDTACRSCTTATWRAKSHLLPLYNHTHLPTSQAR